MYSRMTTHSTIKKITTKIVNNFHPQKIIMFGSWAWGKPHPDSDIDFFIVKESAERRIDRGRSLQSHLFGHRFPPMDLLIYTPSEVEKRITLEDPFILDILKRGKVLYEQQ